MHFAAAVSAVEVFQVDIYTAYRDAFLINVSNKALNSPNILTGMDVVKLVPKCFPQCRLNRSGYVVQGLRRRTGVDPSAVVLSSQHITSLPSSHTAPAVESGMPETATAVPAVPVTATVAPDAPSRDDDDPVPIHNMEPFSKELQVAQPKAPAAIPARSPAPLPIARPNPQI